MITILLVVFNAFCNSTTDHLIALFQTWNNCDRYAPLKLVYETGS